LGAEFIIKIDQISLKYLLEQRINTPMQHRGFSKLMGLNYKIEYKKSVENKVADVLSRVVNPSVAAEHELQVVSEIIPQWVSDIQVSYVEDKWITSL
jgi:hypothetical protein